MAPSVEDVELDASTTLRKGRVIAHSKDRDAIHRALKKHTGNLCIHFDRRSSSRCRDHLLIMPRVVFDRFGHIYRCRSSAAKPQTSGSTLVIASGARHRREHDYHCD